MTNLLRRTVPAAAVAALALSALAGCGDEDAVQAGDPATSSAAASSTPNSPAASQTSASDADTTGAAAGGQIVSPFFVGDSPQGPRLFREVHTGVQSSDAITSLEDGPTDPDYRSLVPAGSLQPQVNVDGSGSTLSYSVDLTDAKWTKQPGDMSAADAKLAVQQLVWTLETMQGGSTYDPTVRGKAPVSFYLGGKEVSYLGIPSGVKPAPELRTLGLVNVTEPTDGASLDQGEVTFSGMSSSFEATIGWEIHAENGDLVKQGSAMAKGFLGKLYPWTTTVDLSQVPAGEYTFQASTDDPTGGEGPGPTTDTKTFTIK